MLSIISVVTVGSLCAGSLVKDPVTVEALKMNCRSGWKILRDIDGRLRASCRCDITTDGTTKSTDYSVTRDQHQFMNEAATFAFAMNDQYHLRLSRADPQGAWVMQEKTENQPMSLAMKIANSGGHGKCMTMPLTWSEINLDLLMSEGMLAFDSLEELENGQYKVKVSATFPLESVPEALKARAIAAINRNKSKMSEQEFQVAMSRIEKQVVNSKLTGYLILDAQRHFAVVQYELAATHMPDSVFKLKREIISQSSTIKCKTVEFEEIRRNTATIHRIVYHDEANATPKYRLEDFGFNFQQGELSKPQRSSLAYYLIVAAFLAALIGYSIHVIRRRRDNMAGA